MLLSVEIISNLFIFFFFNAGEQLLILGQDQGWATLHDTKVQFKPNLIDYIKKECHIDRIKNYSPRFWQQFFYYQIRIDSVHILIVVYL